MQNEVNIRSGTTTEWSSGGTILGVGEVGVDITRNEIKVGDGTSAFAALPGSGRSHSGKATLVAGTKVVTDTAITANSIILVTAQSLGTVTAAKPLAVTARSVGASFTITSSDNTDTSVVGYTVIEP